MPDHAPNTLAIVSHVEALLKIQTPEKPAVLSDFQKVTYRDYLLIEWQNSKVQLENWKAIEMQLRKACVDFAFDPNKEKGTERIDLGNGYQAKAEKKINYGFLKREDGKTDKRRIDDALDMIEQRTAAGALIAERLIKWTPELSLTEYKQLEPEDKRVIDAVIVTSPGAPTLEIIPPKAAK